MDRYFKFDFGEKNTSDDFIKIKSDTLYSEKVGYGLEQVCRSVVRDKGEKDNLKDYLVFNSSSFKVKLDNGNYNVRIYTGDYDDEGDVTSSFEVNGKKVSTWVKDSTVQTIETTVEVNDGYLIVRGLDGKHMCLNALEFSKVKEVKPVKVIAVTDVNEKKADVSLNWSNIEDAYAYSIKRRNLSNNETEYTKVTKSLLYIDDEVEICGNYEYLISPLDECMFSIAKETSVIVYVTDNKGVSGEICDLKAKESAASVSLAWKGFAEALYYNVYRKDPHGLNRIIAKTNKCEYTDSDIITFIEYEYSVEGVTTSGITEKAYVRTNIMADKPKRHMETLNRGAVAVKTKRGIFVSWRLRAYEYDKDISFLVYRNGERITELPIDDRTNYLDTDGKPGDEYTIKAVKDGLAERDGETVKAYATDYITLPLSKPEPYTTPDGNVYEYITFDVIPADLDGDGEYEFVVQWMANPKDNAHKGYTGVCYLDAYKIDGTRMWRINLGINIRCGHHYAQTMVYDFDNDGKAELICKTADGTIDGAGTVIGDINADYRNANGYIIEGPEFLSLFDGETGKMLDTVPYDPPRGNVIDWGDSWGNRVDRFLACVAYLDGINPSAVMCRGYYDHGCPTVLAAYDVIDKKLKKRWVFRADKNQNIEYTAQGNHNLGVGDIDGDGKDEIVYGAMAVDHDGTGIYSTGLGHGDGMHLGKFMPDGEGLEFFQIHEDSTAKYGYEVRNPATGKIAWGYFTGRDTARGMCAKVDPRYEGNQIWARNEQLYTFDGELICEEAPKTCKFPVWWDGDLLRELLDYTPDEDVWQNGSPFIYKWDWKNSKLDVIYTPEGARSIPGTKGTPCLQADIIGDWRENLVYANRECTELRIYIPTEPTPHKFYTLMHDHVYRLAIAYQNTGYNSPPHTGFYIGPEMKKPPMPDSIYVNGENLPEFTEEI